MAPKKVSIIVPYYNSKSSVGQMIESVKAQSLKNFEAILVDDGSTDGSYEYISELIENDVRFTNVKRPDIYLPGGRGAKNFGYTLSDSEFVVFFDSDDVMYTDYLSNRTAFLTKYPEKDAVVSDFGWRVRPEEKKKNIYRYNREIFHDFRENVNQDWFWTNYMDYRFWFNPGNPMWRRSSIHEKPMWDETTSIGEDHEYHARLMLSGLDIGIIDGVHWDYMANVNSMIATSESIKPLLSRSWGKMLVIKNIEKHLGYRGSLLRKELTWQVKILRRIVACKSERSEMEEAINTMFDRIKNIIDKLPYSRFKKSLLISLLKVIVQCHKRTGMAHSAYTLVIKDLSPTLEFKYFTIS
jgi:glycosyltransferase involved in cell wall biosynthesis